MKTASPNPRRHPDIRWKRVGDTGILLNLVSGEYFELEEHAMAIWSRLDGKTSVAKLIEALAAYYGTTPRLVTRDVDAFMAVMKKRKLIVSDSRRAS